MCLYIFSGFISNPAPVFCLETASIPSLILFNYSLLVFLVGRILLRSRLRIWWSSCFGWASARPSLAGDSLLSRAALFLCFSFLSNLSCYSLRLKRLSASACRLTISFDLVARLLFAIFEATWLAPSYGGDTRRARSAIFNFACIIYF